MASMTQRGAHRPAPDAGPAPPARSPGWAAAGADSSNRPWETDSLRISKPGLPALGVMAVAAAVLLSIADMALLYSPTGGYTAGDYGFLAAVPRWRLLLGHYLGILVLPFYLAGYWLVYRGLEQAGGWLSWPVLLLAAYATAVGSGLHAPFAVLGLIVQQGAAGEAATAQQLIGQARAFVEPLQALVVALSLAASLWFAVAVASGRSEFPRWLAAANPFVLFLLFATPYFLAPAFKPALLALPAAFSLAHVVFFALVTLCLGGRH